MKGAYFDASYLAKLHWKEVGSAEVVKFTSRIGVAACSIHGRTEFAAVGHRKMREKLADPERARAVFQQMEDATRARALQWLEPGRRSYQRVERMFLSDPGSCFLRAADALHLACAAEHGFNEIYSNDRHLLAAAPLFGLRGIDVIGAT